MIPARRRRWPGGPTGPTSLGAKLVLILTAAGVGGALAITLLLATVITPSLDRVERATVEAQVERTQAMLADATARVERAARDDGWSDASYADLTHPAAASPPARVSPLALASLGVEGIAYVAPDGVMVGAGWLDRASLTERPALARRLAAAIGRVDLASALHDAPTRGFFLQIGRGIAAIGVAAVRRSDGTGSPRGHVVTARLLTAGEVGDLLKVRASIAPATVGAVEIVAASRARTDVRVPLIGPDGRAVAAVRFGVAREITLLGRRMLLLAVAGSTLLLLLVLVVLRRIIGRHVLAPLHRVEAHMQRVRASGSLSPLAEDDRGDEIGSLGRSFNAMLRQLHDLREQIEAQSFALGRSDSTVAVMHNVRNALNPVTTILSQGIAQPPPVAPAMLHRAVDELAGATVAPERREQLAAFVAAGIEAWAHSRDAMRGELAIGREAMAHALEIIGQQQQRAHERPPLEVCDATEVVARNAAIARYSDGGAIVFSFPTQPTPVFANRVILSQVIGNLFGNATEAIAARAGGTGRIAVTVEQREGVAEIRIADDGEGFDAAAGAALFQRGFSTRRHKSGGLGLHWCANSMTAMDGALRLESAGPGQGAVAILTLVAADAVRAAA